MLSTVGLCLGRPPHEVLTSSVESRGVADLLPGPTSKYPWLRSDVEGFPPCTRQQSTVGGKADRGFQQCFFSQAVYSNLGRLQALTKLFYDTPTEQERVEAIELVEHALKKHPTGLTEVCECIAKYTTSAGGPLDRAPQCEEYKTTYATVNGLYDLCILMINSGSCHVTASSPADIAAVMEVSKQCYFKPKDQAADVAKFGYADRWHEFCDNGGDNACMRALSRYRPHSLPQKAASFFLPLPHPYVFWPMFTDCVQPPGGADNTVRFQTMLDGNPEWVECPADEDDGRALCCAPLSHHEATAMPHAQHPPNSHTQLPPALYLAPTAPLSLTLRPYLMRAFRLASCGPT